METDDKNAERSDIDLEDGEIESDGDDVELVKVEVEKKDVQSAKNEKIIREDADPKDPPTDEWAVRVEKAIANVLKKDGIEVAEPSEKAPQPRSTPGPSQAPKRPRNGAEDQKPPRRRKRKREESKEAKRKAVKGDRAPREDNVEDYEMLCIRGGSPQQRHYDNESDHSYSSYSSYDSGEYRRQRKRQRGRRGGGFGGPKHFDKRRQHHDSDNESRQPRKLELCKFYLMDCCAKREKCLYMHSDFPCKYYYLGLNCMNREVCKFSHGRPLTNQLRGVLLKHLETAPKEILGDFPRLDRDHAINMLNLTHKKLMAEFEDKTKTAKPRKSRWCGETKKSQEDVLSLRHLTNVLTQEQIDRMATMGIETVNQVQQLTFMQLTELGLNFQQLNEIQLNTQNFAKLGLMKGAEESEKEKVEKVEKVEKIEKVVEVEKEKPEKPEKVDKVEDVDMRVIEPTEMVSLDEQRHVEMEEEKKNSTYLDFGAQSPENEEPKLLIDEMWYSDDASPRKEPEKSPSDTEYWPPKPPVVEAADMSRVVAGSLAKIDYSSQILPPIEASPEDTSASRDPRQKKPDTRQQKPSIYDQGAQEDEMPQSSQDQDMRVLPLEIRDVDLRLPFKPLMTNYIPATEIDASLASHPPIVYKVVECDIPPPDYREIRKRMSAQGSTQDPRLRRILSLRDAEVEEEEPEADPARAPPPAVRLDPRRKRDDAPKSAPTGGIDIQQVLQKSPWYKDLGSKNKIMVNQELALLSAELKRFAADATPGKVFDITVVTRNPTLQHILAQLNICLGENGQFTLMEEGAAPQPRLMEWMGPRMPGFMPGNRPGLLGVAPMHPGPPFDFYGGVMPDFFGQRPPGDMPRPRPPFRGRPDRWVGRPRRHFEPPRSGRRDKPSKN